MNINTDETTLIFKNIPKQIESVENLLRKLNIPAKEVKPFGRKRVLINYELKSVAQHALDVIGELEFAGKPANISLFRKDKPKENKKPVIKKHNRSVQTMQEAGQTDNITQQQISKYVQKLYATESNLGFDQPPPPYLKYSYPPINKDIMDNICISLLSNKRFYTQVLHLMNRMNLEPPFTARQYKFTTPGWPQETGTQTEEYLEQKKLLPENKSPQIEEIESELESSEEDDRKLKASKIQIKRKLPPQLEHYKKKAKQILQTTQKLTKENLKKSATSNLSLKEIFETPEHTAAAQVQKIDLQLKRPQKPCQLSKPTFSLPHDLSTQKMSSTELENLSIYKNYQKGQPSNKLYIKNLHKDVTEDELKEIYQRFIGNNRINLDIKVMQHGRMKGQAFVTFLAEPTENVEAIVSKALEETNGFLLREKPMVVCFGKQTYKF